MLINKRARPSSMVIWYTNLFLLCSTNTYCLFLFVIYNSLLQDRINPRHFVHSKKVYLCHKMIVAVNLSQQHPFYCWKRIIFCFIPDYIFVCYMACNNNKLPRMCKLVTYVYTSVMNFYAYLNSCEGCFVIHFTRFLAVNLT